MDSERRKKLIKVMRKIAELKKSKESKDRGGGVREEEEVQYHGPYTDGSGASFFLPRKMVNDRPQDVNFRFDDDGMDGDRLVSNLSWLGRSGELMNLVSDSVNGEDNNDDCEDDDDSTYPIQQRKKVRGGGSMVDDDYMSEKSLRKALPNISQTLRNWTVHGQNLGDIVDSYKKQSRRMPVKKRLRIGNFLNTTSNVLDTIGTMTENTIINSVQFPKNKVVGGGGVIGHQSTDSLNFPPAVMLSNLPATEDNVDRSVDRNVIVPGETFNEVMYSGNFPYYPQGVQLAHNPQKVNSNFAHDSDDSHDSDEEQMGLDSSGELTSSSDDDSEDSYV